MVSHELNNALARRQAAKAEVDRLKTIIAACDAEVMAALDAEDDEFYRWVMEVRGEVQNPESRKIVWTDSTGERYTVSRRKGSEPRKSIAPEKLLKFGVPPHVIQAATVYGEPGKPGVSIRRVMTREEDDEE